MFFIFAGDVLPVQGPDLKTEQFIATLFPTEDSVFLNNQVYRYGGSMGSLNGMEGGQCDAKLWTISVAGHILRTP
ncbi:MAG: hypothetical protein R3C60_13090 [Parvularculaceae bacterium]